MPYQPVFRFLLLSLALLPASAVADSGSERLQAYLEGLHSLQADFEQILTDERGRLLEKSGGEVWLLRPGRFRWDYTHPFHQRIIANGDRIWIYDEDLAQVTIRPLEKSLSPGTALLLGDRTEVEAVYEIRELGEQDGQTWVELVPRNPRDGEQPIRLGFDDKGLRSFRLTDNLGQQTFITLTGRRLNAPLKEELFHFEPPPGVDVIDATADQGQAR